MHFLLEQEYFVCDHATRIENEKLLSKGIAMYALNVPYTSIYGKSVFDLGEAV